MNVDSRAYFVNAPAAAEVSSSGCANTASIQRRVDWFMRVVPPFKSACLSSPPAMVQATACSGKRLPMRRARARVARFTHRTHLVKYEEHVCRDRQDTSGAHEHTGSDAAHG